jgi:hypothetical protein
MFQFLFLNAETGFLQFKENGPLKKRDSSRLIPLSTPFFSGCPFRVFKSMQIKMIDIGRQSLVY